MFVGRSVYRSEYLGQTVTRTDVKAPSLDVYNPDDFLLRPEVTDVSKFQLKFTSRISQ